MKTPGFVYKRKEFLGSNIPLNIIFERDPPGILINPPDRKTDAPSP
jgi:hypothetical protein